MAIDKTLIKYFTVKWTALVSIIDGLDADDLPDTDAITGVITFKPLSGGPLKFRGLVEPFTIFPMTRRVNLTGGEFNDQSRKYIKLEAAVPHAVPTDWNWQVVFDLAYNGTPIPLSPTSFMGAPDQVLDLTDYLPVKDLISGIEYARGPQGFSVTNIVQSGTNGEILTFYSDAPGGPIIKSITVPALTQAANSAAAALVSEGKAKTSETNSKTSETNSKTSETNAKASENAAKASETAAKTSETNSKTSETNAAASATAADGSKTAAATSAGNAAGSATAANTSAGNAASSATAADGSKTAAATSATNASNSATAAQTARTGAETARTGAEQARDAATSMVVPDQAVTRPKIKAADLSNLIFGGGLEGGIEAQDWVANTYGAAATVDTATVWDGTRSLKLTGNGEMYGPDFPTSPGEVFVFSAMQYAPAVVTGSGGLRIQWYNGSAWADVSTTAISVEAAGLAAGVWTRGTVLALMPAGAKRVRYRLAHQLSAWASGVYYDDLDFRRIPDLLPSSIIGTGQLGSKVVTGAKVADNTLADLQIAAAAAIQQSKIATDTGWINTALSGKSSTGHTHTASDISNASTVGRNVLTAADAATARGAIGAGTGSSNLTLGTTAGTALEATATAVTNERTPTDGSVTNAKVAATAAIALSKLAAGYVEGRRNGTPTTTRIEVLTEAQYQSLVGAGTVDANTIYFRS